MMGDWTGIMRPWVIALLLPLATVGSGEIADAIAAAPRAAPVAPAADLEAARALFEKNLDAIRRHDRDAYLACYLNADPLARTGRERPQLGYDSLAKETGEDWPELFERLDLQLVPIRPGLVYGTYRYRVRYGAREDSGISERFFVKIGDGRTDRAKTGAGATGGGRTADGETGGGWKIAVTTAFSALPGTPPPPRALVGATLVDGTGAPPIPDSAVILRGGEMDLARMEGPGPPTHGYY